MSRLTYHRMRVAAGGRDEEGLLALVDGRFVALFTRMDDEVHGEQRGWWHHEFGFGRHDGMPGQFATLGDVTRWIAERLSPHERLEGPAEIGRAVTDAETSRTD